MSLLASTILRTRALMPVRQPDMSHRYRMKYRPCGFATLPQGLTWNYVEAPVMHGLANRPDLPTSRHMFGVFEADRPLTDQEREDYEIEVV
jgi:hypothetical protein